MEINTQNIACLAKIMSICNKQHLKTFEAQFTNKIKKSFCKFLRFPDFP